MSEDYIKLLEYLLRTQHNILVNILTDSQLDTRTKCGQTLRSYFKKIEQLRLDK